jgi:hypothetical protein
MRKVADFEEARNREAYALLEVRRADARFPFDRQEMETDTDFDHYLHVQAAYLTDRLVLNRALNRVIGTGKLPLLTDDSNPLDWLVTNLAVRVEDGGILRVSLRGENAEDNVVILNEVINEYLGLNAEEENNHLKNRLGIVKSMADGYERGLVSHRESLRQRSKPDNAAPPEHSSYLDVKVAEQMLRKFTNAKLELEMQMQNVTGRVRVLKHATVATSK